MFKLVSQSLSSKVEKELDRKAIDFSDFDYH